MNKAVSVFITIAVVIPILSIIFMTIGYGMETAEENIVIYHPTIMSIAWAVFYGLIVGVPLGWVLGDSRQGETR